MKKLLDKLFGPPVWEMDPNHKVEWMTDYGSSKVLSDLERSIDRGRRKSDLFFAKLDLGSIKAKNAVKKLFKLKTDKEYVEKIEQLIGVEAEALLLGLPRDEELFDKLNNIMFLGGSYDPDYNHEAYIKAAKEREGK